MQAGDALYAGEYHYFAKSTGLNAADGVFVAFAPRDILCAGRVDAFVTDEGHAQPGGGLCGVGMQRGGKGVCGVHQQADVVFAHEGFQPPGIKCAVHAAAAVQGHFLLVAPRGVVE